jgi:hypothetical protein
MTLHAVVIPNKYEGKDVDANVRPVVSASPVDNGNIFQLLTKSSTAGQGEVWVATAPVSASSTGIWMALEPEIPFLASAGGNIYNTLGTIQDFYNPAGNVFTAVLLHKETDIITLTAEALDSGTAQAYAVPVAGTYKMAWAAAPSSGFSLQYLNTTYIPSADGSIASGRIVAFQFKVYGN